VVNLGQKKLPNIMGAKGLCFQFKKGNCRKGAGCRWSHDQALVQAEHSQNPGRQQPTKGPFTVTDYVAPPAPTVTSFPKAPPGFPPGFPPPQLPPPSLLGAPPTMPARQGHSGPSMSLAERLALVGIPDGGCIDFAKGRCLREVCRFTHHPK
jgi:hypothetical protein